MTRNRRVIVHGVPYLITCNVSCDTELPLEVMGDAIMHALDQTRARYQALIHAYTVMLDHLHLLLTTTSPYDISQVMHSVKTRSALEIQSRVGLAGPVWQRRFHDHVCRNDREFSAALTHIHGNPVELGVTREPQEWHWSSWYAYAEGGAPPLTVDYVELPFDASRVEWRRHAPPKKIDGPPGG